MHAAAAAASVSSHCRFSLGDLILEIEPTETELFCGLHLKFESAVFSLIDFHGLEMCWLGADSFFTRHPVPVISSASSASSSVAQAASDDDDADLSGRGLGMNCTLITPALRARRA